MTSWQLWRLIVHPPENAIYRQALRQASPAIPWYVGCAELVAFLLILPLILFIGTIYSFGWVIGMSSDIARSRENGTYDLMALTPCGASGTRFALALACLHRINAIERIHQRQTWAGRFIVAGLLGYITLIAPRIVEGEPALGITVALGLALCALVPDQVQSVAIAVLAAVTGAETSAHRVSVQWVAFTLLLALQMGVYGAALSVFLLLASEETPRLIAATLAALATLFITREALFALLWRTLTNRFGVVTVLDLADEQGV